MEEIGSLFDHDYQKKSNENNVKLSNDIFPVIKTAVKPTPSTSRIKRKKRVHHLENTVKATEKLAEQTDLKLELKKHYYDKKLCLLETANNINKESIEVFKRIAIALEKIAG